MARLPAVSFTELRRRAEALGFRPVRRKGSHVRYVHADGRATTIPDHGARDVPQGLLHAIVRRDMKLSWDEFLGI